MKNNHIKNLKKIEWPAIFCQTELEEYSYFEI